MHPKGFLPLALLMISTFAFAANADPAAHPILPPSAPLTAPPNDEDKDIYTIVFENDVFADTDHDYTDGVRASYLSSEANAPDWLKWGANHLLPFGLDGAKHMSLALGQNMYTPTNLSAKGPIRDDRPYAGWLYGSVGVVSDTGKTLDSLQLSLGVVGPYSYAEQTQDFIHKAVTGSPIPQGWDNQIKTEPGIMLTYERKWRALYQLSPFGLGVDFTPQGGVNLGNVETDAQIGGTVRIGYDLPADYGPPRVRPSLPGSDYFVPTKDLGGYLFAGVEGRAVAHNIFLDGNTFANSQHVTREPFVGSVQAGVALTLGEARLSYTQVFMSREFEEQKTPEQFGVVTVSYRF